jgi:hypothetical protein
MDDRQKVCRELLFGRETLTIFIDDACPGLSSNPFDDLCSETRQSVFVGHHNFFDIAALDGSQKPLEALSLEAESGGDIREDFVAWVLGLQFFRLADEVVGLLFGRYTAVDCSFCTRGLFFRTFCDDPGAAVDAADIVSSMFSMRAYMYSMRPRSASFASVRG